VVLRIRSSAPVDKRLAFFQFQILVLTGNDPRVIKRETYMTILQSLPDMRTELGALLDEGKKSGKISGW